MPAALVGFEINNKTGVISFNGVLVNSWTTYAMVIGATTTAPTKGTIDKDIARFRVDGKVLFLNYYLRTTSAGTAGSGVYLFPLPAGFTIDTVLAPPSPAVGTAIEPEGPNLGLAYSHQGTVDGRGIVTVFDGTNLILATENGSTNETLFVSSASFALSGASSICFDAQIPIL